MALLLRIIAAGKPVSRADLAAHTGLTKATVSGLTAELINAGLVGETAARGTDRPGRPATWLVPDAQGPVGIGLSVQTDHIAGYVTDLAGRPTAREVRRCVNTGRAPEQVLRACRPVLRRLLDSATSSGRYVAGVSMAVPALMYVDTDGYPMALRSIALGWTECDLTGLLTAEVETLGAHGIAVSVGNDVEFAAAFEGNTGVYLGGESCLGAVLGGMPAGDFGHSTGNSHTKSQCVCGGQGCLEVYAGPRALGAASPLDRLAAKASGTADGQAIETALTALAEALTPVLALTATATIVLGGYLRTLPTTELGALLTHEVSVTTAHSGADAPIRGAAAHALAHIIDEPTTWLTQLE